MKRALLGVLLTGFVLVFALGCRHGTIVEYKDVKIPASQIPARVGQIPTLDEVGNGIISAGTKLGWSMEIERPGNIFGELRLRGKMVAVDIPYTATAYSIFYRDSANLNYNPNDKTAHSNVSGWMRNLHLAIQREFVGSSFTY